MVGGTPGLASPARVALITRVYRVVAEGELPFRSTFSIPVDGPGGEKGVEKSGQEERVMSGRTGGKKKGREARVMGRGRVGAEEEWKENAMKNGMENGMKMI